MHDLCIKCKKRKTCKVPCRAVELYLAEGNSTLYEKWKGDTVTLYPRSREEQESNLSTGEDKAGDPRLSSKEAQAFSTENENPFRHYEDNHKQTGIFIDRFFGKMSYADLAVKYEVSQTAAHKIYYAGFQKLLEIIMQMDQVRKSMPPEERKRAEVAKSKRYLERNRESVNAARRERYAKRKEKINAKRRGEYTGRKKAMM